MLSYQHGYHAGNFADVIKHLTLTRLLAYMTQKEKPLLYLETHAGRGFYDLKNKQALKTNEARQGIELLWASKDTLPPVFAPYLTYLKMLNPGDTLRYYPGSPWIAIQSLRTTDRLFFSELHGTEFEYLERLPRQGKRVFFNPNEGLSQLNALLPPAERRGLIFIDPSYEIKTDYRDVPKVLKAGYQRFSTGMYCVWYPLVDPVHHDTLIRGLKAVHANNSLRIEFYLTTKPMEGMKGCGLWIINPPFTLKAELKQALEALCQQFNPGLSSYLLEEHTP